MDSLQRILAFVSEHGNTCWIDGGSVVILSPWYRPDTGEWGEDVERARTMGEARAILGY